MGIGLFIKNVSRYGSGYAVNMFRSKIGGRSEEDIEYEFIRLRKNFFEKHPERLKDVIYENYMINMGISRGFDVDLENPRTFTEFIQWNRTNGNLKEMALLADKEEVKKWASDRIGTKYIIPSYGAWNSGEEIQWSKLPEQFVLKCNHGCAMNLIVKNKAALDRNKAIETLNKWLQVDYEYEALEMHYKYINHRIIAEKYISEMDGALHDYKLHCFNGEPLFTQVIDRDVESHTGSQKHYDNAWNDTGWHFEDYPTLRYDMKKPENWNEMLDVARKLSKGIKYVRVDLYNINGSIYLGEMTFTPRGGYYQYQKTWTREKDEWIGSIIGKVSEPS